MEGLAAAAAAALAAAAVEALEALAQLAARGLAPLPYHPVAAAALAAVAALAAAPAAAGRRLGAAVGPLEAPLGELLIAIRSLGACLSFPCARSFSSYPSLLSACCSTSGSPSAITTTTLLPTGCFEDNATCAASVCQPGYMTCGSQTTFRCAALNCGGTCVEQCVANPAEWGPLACPGACGRECGEAQCVNAPAVLTPVHAIAQCERTSLDHANPLAAPAAGVQTCPVSRPTAAFHAPPTSEAAVGLLGCVGRPAPRCPAALVCKLAGPAASC